MNSYLKDYQKVPVEIYPNSVHKNPLVSVLVQTYQHANYITKCIDSLLIQKTNFPLEVLIGEDDSKDGTRNICIEYAQKYPDKIRLFLHRRENVIHIENKATGRFNFLWNLCHAKGKYIALCEGDDYWTDPYKLQKQVDFMEANPDFSICFHPVKIWKEDDQHLVEDYLTREVKSVTTFKELIKGNYIHTPSVLYRRGLFDLELLKKSKSPVGDYLVHMLNAQYGKIKKLPDVMAVYRVHKGGVWSLADKEEKLKKYYLTMHCVAEAMQNVRIKRAIRERMVKGLEKNILKAVFKRKPYFLQVRMYERYYPRNYMRFKKIWKISDNYEILKPFSIKLVIYIWSKFGSLVLNEDQEI